MSDNDRSDILSFYAVGELFSGEGVYAKAIPPDTDTTDAFNMLALQYMIINHGDARPVGIVRTRRGSDGRLEPFKSSFIEPMSDRDCEILDGIVMRIVLGKDGFIDQNDRYAAERYIDGRAAIDAVGGE